jgi:chromosome segregation protein
VYLSRLTAFGFKSFAQKLEISLDKGITCVVGPNGCGKSNVVDALRWALGEQRARSLRSHQMEDVIFSGSRSRKPLGMSEVSLTIDNADGMLPIEYSEVTVTRRLFRSGESDYLLNKIPCRLKDIHNLLMDTGLGATGAYVIEQGMVDEIISDKTEERRRLFEEAAGVTRYKVRRRSAWNKLQSIQQDLQRIADVIAEVERQVSSLKRQERKARLYKQLSDQLQELEILLARFRFFDMSDRAAPMSEEIRFLREDIEVTAADTARLEAQLEAARTDLTQQDQALAAANAEFSQQVNASHRKDREILVAREEAKSIDGFLERAARQAEELKARRETARLGQATAEEGASAARASLAEADEALLQETELLEELNAALEDHRARMDEQKALLIGTLRESSDKGGRLERGRAELEGVAQRQERLEGDLARVKTRLEETEASAADATRQIDDFERELAEQEALRTAHQESAGQVADEHNGLTEARNALRAQSEANSARLTLLQRLRDGFEGYSNGVRALAVDSPFSDDIRGVLTDLIDVDPAHAPAVEAALGRALECLLVDTTEDAVRAVSYLREGGHGAAALLPLERVRHAAGTPWAAPEGEGIVGRAADLLRSRENGHGAVRALLSRTLVVRDADAARPLLWQMRACGVDVVTLQGEVFSADGTVFGGGGEGEQSSLIGRAQEIEGLEAALEEERAQLDRLDASLAEVADRRSELGQMIQAGDARLAGLRNRLAELRRDLENARSEAERQTKAQVEMREERARLDDRETQLQASTEEMAAQLAALEARRGELEAAVLEADEAMRAHESRRREQQEAVGTRRVAIASLKERAQGLAEDARRLTREQEEVASQMARLETECGQSRIRKDELESAVQTASDELETLLKVQSELETARDTQAQRQQELMTGVRELEETLKTKGQQLNRNRDRVRDLEVELTQLKTRAEDLQERMQHDYQLDLKEAGRLDDPEFNADISQKKIVEIEERLRRMGSVNLAALEEYDVQRERYEFLAKQRDDLLEAETMLKRTISKIDREARSRFLDTFARIRENFHRTYSAFFEGGEADLTMPPDEDPLEAPLVISARPRGKRLQNINLLSGGERALTAIALLLAIYLVKPSPFCILDEVDAPLDDANVGRFIRVIKEFSENTQFIVVTHNKVTMEAADALHGITMEEPGVSKLVSVKLGRDEPSGNGHAETLEGATADD